MQTLPSRRTRWCGKRRKLLCRRWKRRTLRQAASSRGGVRQPHLASASASRVQTWRRIAAKRLRLGCCSNRADARHMVPGLRPSAIGARCDLLVAMHRHCDWLRKNGMWCGCRCPLPCLDKAGSLRRRRQGLCNLYGARVRRRRGTVAVAAWHQQARRGGSTRHGAAFKTNWRDATFGQAVALDLRSLQKPKLALKVHDAQVTRAERLA
mmetsp:Transcript_109140/g.314375  ORF Transcript_109140/g.314375 Transcript_109140/m.314375 type:complete len:209 (-) Transcript_109140:978-1604(-)